MSDLPSTPSGKVKVPALNLAKGLSQQESNLSTQLTEATQSKPNTNFYTSREAQDEHKWKGMQDELPEGDNSAQKQTKGEALARGYEEKKKKKRRKKNKNKGQETERRNEPERPKALRDNLPVDELFADSD